MNHTLKRPPRQKRPAAARRRDLQKSRSARIDRLLTPRRFSHHDVTSQAALVLLFYAIIIALEVLLLETVSTLLIRAGL